MSEAVTRLVATTALLGALVAVTGCGGSSSSDTTPTATTSAAVTDTDSGSTFTPAMVEKLIRKSIEPTLATNLGDGSTMKVTCKSTGDGTLSCVTVLVPADTEMDSIRVVYGVTCDTRTCQWQPTG
jgi:hypothetical protein